MEERRKCILKTRLDKIVITVVHILMCGVYLFELLVILPRIYEDSSSVGKNLHIVAGTWILFNAIASLWKFVLVDPGTGSLILPSMLKPGWRFCWKCEANYPPRSFHCFQCEQCVLVRDHHCIIGSNCVGYRTRRYFHLMAFYMWFALLYANLLNMDFVWELFHSFGSKTLLTMFMPLLAWIFGVAEGETLAMAFFSSFCILAFLYGTAVILFHIRNTLKGRTTHEEAKGLGAKYNLGLTENMKSTFGNNWKFAWLSPLIPSPMPGDGLTFVEKELLSQCGKNL
uniref:Palmitoyltransferase n=1 Tax=Ciona savignyi TaxID=51511 RepID=H2Y8J1_CIOSA